MRSTLRHFTAPVLLTLLLLLSPAPVLTRPPLIAYTGQPLELSAAGLRSVEAIKSARYATQLILQEQVSKGLVSPCAIATANILHGSYKVVAGIQYNLRLQVLFRPSPTPQCRGDAFNNSNNMDDVCDVEVVYQPYKPTVATFALVKHSCRTSSFIEPEAN